VPGIDAGDVVDDDGGAPAASDVAELLRPFEVVAADIDGVEVGVVGPADGDDVRRSVLADGGDAGLAALPLK